MGDGPEVTLIVNTCPGFCYLRNISNLNMKSEQDVTWLHSHDLSSNVKNKVVKNLFSYEYLSVHYDWLIYTFLSLEIRLGRGTEWETETQKSDETESTNSNLWFCAPNGRHFSPGQIILQGNF